MTTSLLLNIIQTLFYIVFFFYLWILKCGVRDTSLTWGHTDETECNLELHKIAMNKSRVRLDSVLAWLTIRLFIGAILGYMLIYQRGFELGWCGGREMARSWMSSILFEHALITKLWNGTHFCYSHWSETFYDSSPVRNSWLRRSWPHPNVCMYGTYIYWLAGKQKPKTHN